MAATATASIGAAVAAYYHAGLPRTRALAGTKVVGYAGEIQAAKAVGFLLCRITYLTCARRDKRGSREVVKGEAGRSPTDTSSDSPIARAL